MINDDRIEMPDASKFHGNNVFGMCVQTHRKLEQPRRRAVPLKVIYLGPCYRLFAERNQEMILECAFRAFSVASVCNFSVFSGVVNSRKE